MFILVISFFQVPTKPLLPQIKSKDSGKICVVIDLDETLVHSSFKVRGSGVHPLKSHDGRCSMTTLYALMAFE